MNSIISQPVDLPREAPVMVLPTPHFPNSLLPLHIFEPRYRAMVEWALERDRMFCVALLKRGVEEWHSTGEFYHTAGIGLVRACVGREDGTSHLILQGLSRVELTGFTQEKPFPLAKIRELPSQPPETLEAAALTARLLKQCAQFRASGHPAAPGIDEQLAGIVEPEVLTDVIAHTFVQDPFRRQEVLEEPRVSARMRLVLQHLAAEGAE